MRSNDKLGRHSAPRPGMARVAIWTAILGSALSGPLCGAEQTVDQRLTVLEQQVRALTQRLKAVEGRTATPAGNPEHQVQDVVWSFDAYLDSSPFKVTYKRFERKSGKVELLLQITAPLERPDVWTGVGRPVPIGLTLRTVGGAEGRAGFTLKRGGGVDPGAFLHVQAQIDPARAAAAGQLIIGHLDR